MRHFHAISHNVFALSRRLLSVALLAALTFASTAQAEVRTNLGTVVEESTAAAAADAIVLAPTADFDVLYAPSEADDPVFRAAIGAFVSGNVDYLDTRVTTPTAEELLGYECVFSWTNLPYADEAGFGDVLATFVDDGGSVVLGAFALNPGAVNVLAGAITTDLYAPVIGNGANAFGASSAYAGDGTTYIHDGVVAYSSNFHDVVALQGAGIQDGSFLDGEIATAYRPDFAVVYTGGAGGLPDGVPDGLWEGNDPDYPRLVANACMARSVVGGGDEFVKELTSGSNNDGDEAIDVVVPVKPGAALEYDFTIHYSSEEFPHVLIVDTLPAEWVAVQVEGVDIDGGEGGPGIDACGESVSISDAFGDIDLYKNGKGKKCKSATTIEWDPPEDGGSVKIDADTRPSPGKGHKEPVFAPTSCGALSLNDGAIALETNEAGELILDEEGNPTVVAGPTDGICLAAVSQDLYDALVDYSDQGDHDGDGLSSHEEACGEIGTDPCNPDTDGDGVVDGEDACPLEGPPDASIGELQEPDGCNRQSQCSDGEDNELDGFTDFPEDLSCDSILDDSEDTPDPV
ncbi:MAG: hypothetical protein R3348_05910 [Xanthomonadales bacterium]|nr:hypothetical protein [Xanthomonadales bacterium]